MKKILFVAVIMILALPSDSFAQVENRFSIGPRVGVNFANINSKNTKSQNGLVAGITSTYSINEQSGITVDVLYSGEGYQSGATEINLNYLRIPILYNSFFGSLGEPFRPKIYLGFAPGFLLNAEANAVEVTDSYKSSVVDLVGGLGFNYRLANRIWLNTDLRAFLGLAPFSDGSDSKNRTIQLSLGIAYGL